MTETFLIVETFIKIITRLAARGWAKAKGVPYPPGKSIDYPSGKSQY